MSCFIKSLRGRWGDWRYGKFPRVNGIVKRDRKVYLSHDHHKQLMHVIYRHGKRKKVLDTFSYKINSNQHFSLEWHEDDRIMVRRYDDWKNVVMMEKELELPKN